MRVTNSSMVSSYLKDLQSNLQNMNKLNTQINTSQNINTISDDPFKTIKLLNLKNEIKDVEKYNSNADEVMGWIDVTDEALDRVGSLTTDIKTLLTSIQGTFGPDEIKAVQTEINEKMKQIGEAMNSTYAGEYVFGGSATDEAPIKMETDPNTGLVKLTIRQIENPASTSDDDKYMDDPKLNESLVVEISDGISLNHNLTINQITKTAGDKTGSKTGLELLNTITDALGKDQIDMDTIGNIKLDLDSYMSDIMNNRALIGGKSNTVSAIKDSNDENILEMKGTYSLMQDVDIAEKFIELKSAEMMYTASLQVGAKLIQPTLLDYLR